MKAIICGLAQLFLTIYLFGQARIDIFMPAKNLRDFEDIFTQGEFVLKGKIEQSDQNFIEMAITTMHGDQETLAIPLKPDGTFEMALPIIGVQEIFYPHDINYYFQVKSADTLEIYQPKRRTEPLRIVQKKAQSFRDTEYRSNLYMSQNLEQLTKLLSDKSGGLDKTALAEHYFNGLVQSLYDHVDPAVYDERIYNLIDNEYWRTAISLMFTTSKPGIIRYDDLTMEKMKIAYVEVKPGMKALNKIVPASFGLVPSDLPTPNDASYIASPHHRTYFLILLDYSKVADHPRLYYRAGKAGPLLQRLHQIVGQYGYSSLISESLICATILKRSKHYQADDLQASYTFGQHYIESPFLKNKLQEHQIFVKTLEKGVRAPDFEFEDRHGNPVSLSSFSGKAVYLDFWGLYCGPCLVENSNYAATVYDYYEEKDVVFINVCIDVNRDLWHKNLKPERENVVELYAVGKKGNDFVKAYNINGIPHYILIDQKGIMFNNNADRPSSFVGNLTNNELSRLLQR